MLSNLETAKGKLIQILLVGQPELGEKLGRPELRQLRQRISLVAELKPLSYEDTVHYITHRLGVAGHQGPNLFSPRALRLIHRASDGIPRLVNVICDKALVLGYGADKKRITSRIVREVLKDWRHFQQRPAAATVRARTRAGARARGAGRRPLARRAAVALACLVGAALVVAAVTHRDGDLLGRVWRGLRPAGASGTVASAAPMLPPPAPRPGAGQTRPSAELAPALPARAEAREAAPPAPESAPPPPLTAKAEPASLGAARGSSREVVVGPGEVFSGLVTRHYGFAELTLLDFVKSANPNVDSIDMVLVGQKLKLPPFEPAALVHAAGSSGYRLHLMTVWDTQSQMIQKLRPAVTNLGRQLYVVPVSLTSKDTAYRVLVGDFADRQEAEAFYRSFRAPAGVSSQLWK
jgi:general secretion pathway protein A